MLKLQVCTDVVPSSGQNAVCRFENTRSHVIALPLFLQLGYANLEVYSLLHGDSGSSTQAGGASEVTLPSTAHSLVLPVSPPS